LRVWKAYNIGTGKFIPYVDIESKNQGPTDLSTIETFFPINDRRAFTPKSSALEKNEDNDLYVCTEENSSFSFKTLDELEIHVAIDRHSKPDADSEGIFDKLRRDWAKRFVAIDKRVVTSQSTSSYNNEKSETLPMGWALQKGALSRKFPEART